MLLLPTSPGSRSWGADQPELLISALLYSALLRSLHESDRNNPKRKEIFERTLEFRWEIFVIQKTCSTLFQYFDLDQSIYFKKKSFKLEEVVHCLCNLRFLIVEHSPVLFLDTLFLFLRSAVEDNFYILSSTSPSRLSDTPSVSPICYPAFTAQSCLSSETKGCS